MGDEAIVCPVCGKEYPASVIICVHCGIDMRTGEELPATFYRPESFNWGRLVAIAKGLIYLALLAGVVYFGWRMYKGKGRWTEEEEKPAARPSAQLEEAPASVQPVAEEERAGARNAVVAETRAGSQAFLAASRTQADKLAAALVLAASPGEHSVGVNRITALLRKDMLFASRMLEDPDPMVRIALAKALGNIANEEAVAHLFTLIADDDRRVAEAVGTVLQRIKRDLLFAEAARAIDSPKMEIRRGAMGILVKFPSTDMAASVAKLLDDADPVMVIRAVNFFTNIQADEDTYCKLLELAATTEDPAMGAILTKVIFFRTDKTTEPLLADEIKRFPRDRFFMLIRAAAKVRGGDAGIELRNRVNVGLAGMPEKLRKRVRADLYSPNPRAKRVFFVTLGTDYQKPGGYGALSALWLGTSDSATNQVAAATLWSWQTSAAPFALASCLGDEDAFTAITAAIALSRQEKSAAMRAVDMLLQSGSAQEKALASAVAHLAGRTEAIEDCREALNAGGISGNVTAFLRAFLAEAGDEDAIQAARSAVKSVKKKTLESLLAKAALVLAGEDGAPGKLAEIAGDVRPSGADLLVGYFLWRAAAAGNEKALTPLLSIYTTRDSLHTAVFLGTLLALEKPSGLPQALRPLLDKVNPRMAAGLALAMKPYGDEIAEVLIEALNKGTPAERKSALCLFAELGADSENARVAIVKFLRDIREDERFFKEVRGLLKKMTGQDAGPNWEEWAKLLTPEHYDINDELLFEKTYNLRYNARRTVAVNFSVSVPKRWKARGAWYREDRLPGKPSIRVRFESDTGLPRRRYPNPQTMLREMVQRYSFDMLTRKAIKVDVEKPETLRKGKFVILYTAVIDEKEGMGRLLGCGMFYLQGVGYYAEVEGACGIEQFDRYRPFFEKIIKSMEIKVPGR